MGRFAGLTAMTALLCCSGCGLSERLRGYLADEERSAAAVKVGDKLYSKSDLDRFFDSRLSEFRDPADADKVKSNLLESFIEDRLLLTAAEKRNVEANPQVLKTMMEKMAAGPPERGESADPKRDAELKKNLTESLKMQQYLHEYLLKDISITDGECEAYYDNHMGEYVRNDVVRLREILVDDAALAQKVVGLLAKERGRNFAEIARSYSKGPSASEGGDLGSFQRGELPEEFERVVFAITPGTVSKVVRTKYGFHVFLVEEKIPAHQQKFWEVKDQIRERLQQERERDLINKELASLASRIPVEIYRENLDFTYKPMRLRSQ